jgi:predicted PurR-regulated permease PerM
MNRSLNSIRRSLSIMATISVLVTLYFAKDLVLPILIGVLLALTPSPLTRFFRRLGVPYVLSGPILILVTASSIAFIIAFSTGTINSLVDDAPAMGRELREKLSGITKTIDEVRDASKEVEDLASADAPPEVQEVVIRQSSLLDSAVSNVSSFATTVTLALVLATFLLVSGDLFYIKLVQSFQSMSDKKRALSAVYDIERKVSRYLLTITHYQCSPWLFYCRGADRFGLEIRVYLGDRRISS